MNWKKTSVVFVLVILVLGSVTLLAWPKKSAGEITGMLTANGDTFKGKITNMVVEPGELKGMGTYDKSCQMLGNGLTGCDAGIKTEKYGVLNFKYQHNMQQQPCLAPNDVVVVKILDKEGNAEIQRV